jgi:hypothetical protein
VALLRRVRVTSREVSKRCIAPRHAFQKLGLTANGRTVTFAEHWGAQRGRSGVEAAHVRAATQSLSLDSCLYASAQVPQYPGNVIN